MRILQKAIGFVLRPAAERKARRRSFQDLADDLQNAYPAIADHLAGKPDTPANREAIAHCVGIERWGQSRLRVALGAPLEMDTYHPYRPDVADGVEALAAAMAATREETVALARTLHDQGVAPTDTVPHNDLGDLSLAGWLAYLQQHASRELPMRVRG